MDTTAEDGTAEDATGKLSKRGRRYGGATRIQLLTLLWMLRGDTAESLQYNDVSVSVTVQKNLSNHSNY